MIIKNYEDAHRTKGKPKADLHLHIEVRKFRESTGSRISALEKPQQAG